MGFEFAFLLLPLRLISVYFIKNFLLVLASFQTKNFIFILESFLSAFLFLFLFLSLPFLFIIFCTFLISLHNFSFPRFSLPLLFLSHQSACSPIKLSIFLLHRDHQTTNVQKNVLQNFSIFSTVLNCKKPNKLHLTLKNFLTDFVFKSVEMIYHNLVTLLQVEQYFCHQYYTIRRTFLSV